MTEPRGRPERPFRGIALKVMSVCAFVAMQTTIKAAGDIPAGQIVFFRSFFAIFPIVAMLALRRELSGALRTDRPVSHIMRGLIGVGSMGLGFFALTRLPLPEYIVIGYAQPLMVVIISALAFGETVRIYRWSAVVVGLLGVLVVSWPKLTLFTGGAVGREEAIGLAACFVSALISAVAYTLVRSLVATERTATIVLWFSLSASVMGLLTLPFGWTSLSTMQTTLLVFSGVCGGMGQMLMTECYRHADMSTVAPFEYTSMILGIAAGYFVFSEVPSLYTVIGGAVIVASGIFIIWREQRVGLGRARARKLVPAQGP